MSFDDVKWGVGINANVGCVELYMHRANDTSVILPIPFLRWDEMVALVIHMRQGLPLPTEHTPHLTAEELATLTVKAARARLSEQEIS